VGPKRQAALLKALGSVRRIRTATLTELGAVPGMTQRAAQAVRAFYDSGAAPPDAAPPPPAATTAAPEEVLEDAAAQELAELADPKHALAEEPRPEDPESLESLATQIAALAQASANSEPEPPLEG
jgi:hypothetical protein